jgi:Xaa-Pro aminopeptidase
MALLFERVEYEARVARTKARMAERGLDALVVASPANQFWLTGYDGWSFYTPQVVVVTLDRAEPVWIGRKMDSVGAQFTAYLAPENVIPYPDTYVASTERHPLQFVAAWLAGKGYGAARIGVEMDDYYYTARWHAHLTAGLPDAKFQDAFLLVNWLRLKKSPAEIAYLRQAGEIAAHAMKAAVAAAAPGVRQCDVMAELYKAQIGGTPEHGGTFPCKPPNAMVGELCAAPHLSWTEAKLAPGDLFYIEMGGVRHRYHSPLSRCVHLGKAPEKMRDTVAVIVEGLEAVLAAVKPGGTLESLEAVWKKVIARHGVDKDSRIGYPVGIGYPPTWGELTCSIRAGDKTVLEPGMSFHCIPALWFDKYGLVVSESFVVTETGAACFADCPRVLFEK